MTLDARLDTQFLRLNGKGSEVGGQVLQHPQQNKRHSQECGGKQAVGRPAGALAPAPGSLSSCQGTPKPQDWAEVTAERGLPAMGCSSR